MRKEMAIALREAADYLTEKNWLRKWLFCYKNPDPSDILTHDFTNHFRKDREPCAVCALGAIVITQEKKLGDYSRAFEISGMINAYSKKYLRGVPRTHSLGSFNDSIASSVEEVKTFMRDLADKIEADDGKEIR